MVEPPDKKNRYMAALLKTGICLNALRGMWWGAERIAALWDGNAAGAGLPVPTAIAHLVEILRSLGN